MKLYMWTKICTRVHLNTFSLPRPTTTKVCAECFEAYITHYCDSVKYSFGTFFLPFSPSISMPSHDSLGCWTSSRKIDMFLSFSSIWDGSSMPAIGKEETSASTHQRLARAKYAPGPLLGCTSTGNVEGRTDGTPQMVWFQDNVPPSKRAKAMPCR